MLNLWQAFASCVKTGIMFALCVLWCRSNLPVSMAVSIRCAVDKVIPVVEAVGIPNDQISSFAVRSWAP